MTLTTRIEIFHPDADPEALFGALRDAVGIPPEQPFTLRRDRAGIVVSWDEITFKSEPGGFPAAVHMTLRPDPPAEHWEFDEWDSGWHIALSLDTAGADRWTYPFHLFALGQMIGVCNLPDGSYRIHNEGEGTWYIYLNGVLYPVAEPEELKPR